MTMAIKNPLEEIGNWMGTTGGMYSLTSGVCKAGEWAKYSGLTLGDRSAKFCGMSGTANKLLGLPLAFGSLQNGLAKGVQYFSDFKVRTGIDSLSSLLDCQITATEGLSHLRDQGVISLPGFIWEPMQKAVSPGLALVTGWEAFKDVIDISEVKLSGTKGEEAVRARRTITKHFLSLVNHVSLVALGVIGTLAAFFGMTFAPVVGLALGTCSLLVSTGKYFFEKIAFNEDKTAAMNIHWTLT